MLASTAVMLPLVFPPFYLFPLAAVALVPFVVCIIRRPMKVSYVALYYALGVAFFLPSLFWLYPVTIGGFIGLACFVALYFPLFAVGVHRLVVHLRLPATVAVPLVWTAVEYLRSTFVLGGFPWFLLGNCPTPVPLLIQGADLFGVWGLSFYLALVNGFFVDLLRLPLRVPEKNGTRFSPAIRRLASATALLSAALLGYGVYRLQQQTTRPGPIVAVIQENIPQSIKDAPGTRDEVFIKHLQLSRLAALSTPRPDLVVWPETMVTAPINRELLEVVPDEFTSDEQLRQKLKVAEEKEDEYLRIADVNDALNQLVRQTGTPVLVGYGAFVPKTAKTALIQNRTLLLAPGATEPGITAREDGATGGATGVPTRVREYNKIHLVPFGEYIPFRGVPVISKMMLWFSPVDYDYSNTPGTEWTRFPLTLTSVSRATDAEGNTLIHSSMRAFLFATPICFEDTMPEPAWRMTSPQFSEGGARKTDFLVNVSNDGWFHWVELDQHLQACQLRAVENRIAIARSVNTGNSGFIDSNGRIVKLVADASGRSIGTVGFASLTMPIDSRSSLYAQIGDLFPILCGILSTVLVGWTLVRPRLGARAEGK